MGPFITILAVINLAGFVYAIASGEVMHALGHLIVAPLLFAWSRRSRRHRHAATESQDQIDVLEDEVTQLRRELTEAQERLDFTERMMAQRANAERVSS